MNRTRTNLGLLTSRRLTPVFVALVAIAAFGCGSSGPDVSADREPRQTDSAPADAIAGPTQIVRYGPVEFSVPADWPVYDLAADPSICVRFDVHAVYLGHPGADMECPATIFGHAASLLVEPIDGAANLDAADVGVPGPNGLTVEADPAAGVENQLRVKLPTAGLTVTVTFEDSPASTHQIIETFHWATP